ncbi:MAG TPA: GIY-YIG nuclease family protein [Ilumatobacter sp.]|nr:GIY-YIG nuclease family protein [Ilumatobacter sp.]
MAFTYILECADGSLYVGSTRNLEARLWQHRNGAGAEYTRHRLPVRLMWAHEFARVDEAFAFEKKVQRWGRAKRLALIEGRFAELAELSRKQFPVGGGLDTPPGGGTRPPDGHVGGGGLDTPPGGGTRPPD